MLDKEKMLAIVDGEIAVQSGLVGSEMERIKKYSDPSLIAIVAESLNRHNYALKTLKELKKKLEAAE